MSRRSQHNAVWVAVQMIFALSGAIGLFVGVINSRCDLPTPAQPRSGSLGAGSSGGLEFQTLFEVGRWGIVLGMAGATAAVLLGMFLSWKNQVHVRTLLLLMALSAAQFIVTLTLWSIQTENQTFCGLDLPTIATSILIAALMAITVALCLSNSVWSSADLQGDAPPLHQPATRQPAVAINELQIDELSAPTPPTGTFDASEIVRRRATSETSAPSTSVSGPFVIQMAGRGGVGKSLVAKNLGSRLDASVIDLDVIKTELLDAGVAWDAASAGSYATIYRLVDELLAAASPIIIVDTPSYWPEIHERLTALADRHGASYGFIECTASEQTRTERLASRTPMRSQAGNADANPTDAPDELANVHDRDIARPSGRALFQIDTEHDVDIDAIISLLVGVSAN